MFMKTVHFLFTFSYKNNNPYLAGGPQTLGRALGYTQAAPFINTVHFLFTLQQTNIAFSDCWELPSLGTALGYTQATLS
jgi:hypothetical protein